MACPEEDLPMERGKGQQTTCPRELGADRRKTPPYSGSETSPAPIPATIDRVIDSGGMHGCLLAERGQG